MLYQGPVLVVIDKNRHETHDNLTMLSSPQAQGIPTTNNAGYVSCCNRLKSEGGTLVTVFGSLRSDSE